MTEKEKAKIELEARLSERSTIVYVLSSNLGEVNFHKIYKQALRDEIQNHELVIAEYKEQLKKLNNE